MARFSTSWAARLPGATVTLVGEQQESAGNATAGGDGSYSIANVAPGRYRVRAELSGFETTLTAPFYVGSGSATVNVSMAVGPLQQAVVVTAAAAEVSQAQTGAPVTVIDQQVLDAINKPDVLEALRLTPGTNIQQTGGRGGNTSIFLRGGNSNFTKVLIDGVSANDIGGGVDLAQLQTTGVGAHRGAAAVQQRDLRQRRADRRGQHRDPARPHARARAALHARRRQLRHRPQRPRRSAAP